MTKYLFGLIGLALLGAGPLPAQAAPCGGEGCCARRLQRLRQLLSALRLPAGPGLPRLLCSENDHKARVLLQVRGNLHSRRHALRLQEVRLRRWRRRMRLLRRRLQQRLRTGLLRVLQGSRDQPARDPPRGKGNAGAQVHRGMGLPELQQWLRRVCPVGGACRAEGGPFGPLVAKGAGAAENGGSGPSAPAFQRGVLQVAGCLPFEWSFVPRQPPNGIRRLPAFLPPAKVFPCPKKLSRRAACAQDRVPYNRYSRHILPILPSSMVAESLFIGSRGWTNWSGVANDRAAGQIP